MLLVNSEIHIIIIIIILRLKWGRDFHLGHQGAI